MQKNDHKRTKTENPIITSLNYFGSLIQWRIKDLSQISYVCRRVFLFKRNKIWFQMLQNFCSILICKSGIQTFGQPGEFLNKLVSENTFASRKLEIRR